MLTNTRSARSWRKHLAAARRVSVRQRLHHLGVLDECSFRVPLEQSHEKAIRLMSSRCQLQRLTRVIEPQSIHFVISFDIVTKLKGLDFAEKLINLCLIFRFKYGTSHIG